VLHVLLLFLAGVLGLLLKILTNFVHEIDGSLNDKVVNFLHIADSEK
jgi:hypothetical protein